MNLFKEVIKHYCSSSQDESGEYSSSFRIDFILTEPVEFNVLGINYKIDRVRMCNADWGWSDDIELNFNEAEKEYPGITIPKKFIRALYRRICKEQKNGILKGWCFDDGIAEIYKNNLIGSEGVRK